MNAGTFSFYVYGAKTGVRGVSVRHVLEGPHQEDGDLPTSCGQQNYDGGYLSQCPESVLVPDECSDANGTGEYSTRAFGSQDRYAPYLHNSKWGDVITPATDTGSILMSNSADFLNQQTPPFAAGAMDSQLPNIAKEPFLGRINPGTEILVHLKSQGLMSPANFYVTDDRLSARDDSLNGTPRTAQMHGGIFYILQNCNAVNGDSGSAAYIRLNDANGNACNALLGNVVTEDFANHYCYVQSAAVNIIPALNAAYSDTFIPAGNCDYAGPKDPAGNYDENNFLWYTQAQTDAGTTADQLYWSFLHSQCDASNNHCDVNGKNWGDIIEGAGMPSLPSGTFLANIGMMSTQAAPTTAILRVELICPNNDCLHGGSISPNQIDSYVTTQIQNAVNSTGFSVLRAMQSFGVSTGVFIEQKALPVSSSGNPLTENWTVPVNPIVQYYAGVLTGYIGGTHRP